MKVLLVALLAVAAGVYFKESIPINFEEVTKQVLEFFNTPSYEPTIHLFKNGFEDGNISHTILNISRPFSSIQKELVELLYPNTPSFEQVQVYNDVGDILTDAKQINNGADIYVSINGELFMHPGKYVGWTRKVSGIEMVTLSLSPRVFHVKNFLTEEACDEIVTKASADEEMHRSVVYLANADEVSQTRTSSTGYVPYTDTMVERSFNLTKLPDDRTYLYPDYHVQVIHYHPNQYFHPHHDGFFVEAVGDEKWIEKGERNRYLTLFLYLNDVEGGGETAFIEYNDYVAFYNQLDKYDVHNNNPCDKAAVRMAPSKGDGLLFYNLKPGGQMHGEIDWNAVHTGCGVKKGEKWACNIWMYNRPTYEPEYVSIMKNVGLLKEDPAGMTARQVETKEEIKEVKEVEKNEEVMEKKEEESAPHREE